MPMLGPSLLFATLFVTAVWTSALLTASVIRDIQRRRAVAHIMRRLDAGFATHLATTPTGRHRLHQDRRLA
jgi:Ser/Thr protein kinase RdoA (MazF antagonist)